MGGVSWIRDLPTARKPMKKPPNGQPKHGPRPPIGKRSRGSKPNMQKTFVPKARGSEDGPLRHPCTSEPQRDESYEVEKGNVCQYVFALHSSHSLECFQQIFASKFQKGSNSSKFLGRVSASKAAPGEHIRGEATTASFLAFRTAHAEDLAAIEARRAVKLWHCRHPPMLSSIGCERIFSAAGKLNDDL